MTTNELKMLRLQTESNALTAAERDLLDVDSRIAVLEQQIADLTLSLGAARDWRTDVASRRDILRERRAATQRAISPFSAYPEDILRLIFAERTREPDTKWTTLGTGTFNKGRAQAPFIIAAVCRDWRRVALTTPIIWSYVGVPSFRHHSVPFVALTRTVIERSCAAPLDILFENMDDSECKTYTQMLDLLFPHLHRWRRVELWSPHRDALFISYLRGNAALLEELCVYQCDTNNQWTADPGPFLVGATHLRTVRLRNSSLILDTRSLPTLQSLMIETRSAMPSTAFWTLLGSTNKLTSLVLELNDWNTVVDAIPVLVELPKLTRLHLHSYATSILVHYPGLLAAPIITELGLHSVPADPELSLTEVLGKVLLSTRLADSLRALSQQEPCTPLLNLCYRHLPRWRSFSVLLEQHVPELFNYLRGPTPFLETLFIRVGESSAVGEWPSDVSLYLQGCAKLRSVILKNARFGINTIATEMSSLAEVVQHVPPASPFACAWNTFAGANQLVKLSFGAHELPSEFHDLPPISSQSLKQLELRGAAVGLLNLVSHSIPAERLTYLSLVRESSNIDNDGLEAFRVYFTRLKGLTELVLQGYTLDQADGAMIAETLQGLDTLSFPDCRIKERFWGSLHTRPANLNLMRLTNAIFLPGANTALVACVRARSPFSGSDRESTTRSLTKVYLAQSFPSRQRIEIGHLLST